MAMSRRSTGGHKQEIYWWPGAGDILVARSRKYTGGQEQEIYWWPVAGNIPVARSRRYTGGQEQKIYWWPGAGYILVARPWGEVCRGGQARRGLPALPAPRSPAAGCPTG